MISKALKANSFYHTARYICQKPGAEVMIAEGVRGHDFRLMAEDFQRQQQMRPGKEKAGGHFILSFHPDEKPSDELIQTLSQEYLSRLGITNTQVVVVKHTDQKHPHLHILANMVDNEGNAISDSWIGLRGKKIAQQLTQEYKLIPAIGKNLQQGHVESQNEEEATKYQLYQAILESLAHCRSMAELEQRLLKLGIETKYKYKGKTEEKQGISFKKGRFCFKGSEVDRKYSLAGLNKILTIQQSQGQKASAQRVAPPRLFTIPRSQKQILVRATRSIPTLRLAHRRSFKIIAKLISILLKPVYTTRGESNSYHPPKIKRKRRPHF